MKDEVKATLAAASGGLSSVSLDLCSASSFKVGDLIRVVRIPSDLHDAAGIGTPEVFQKALGNAFRIEGFDEHGHLELVVAERKTPEETSTSDTIWIEPEFVEKVSEI